jgi:hypothetical protein
MNIKFLPEARAELQDAVAYYEGELSGLGQRLWEEVDRHIEWIERNYEVPRLRPAGCLPSLLHMAIRRVAQAHPPAAVLGGFGDGSVGF